MLDTHVSYPSADRAQRNEPRQRFGWGAALVYRFLEWHERMQQRRHLSALSSHMLKDIGLNSADVYAEIGKRPWQS